MKRLTPQAKVDCKPEGERGIALALCTVAMLAMLLMAGLCIDISHFYIIRTELQNAADAAALSGTSALSATAGGINQAQARAVTAMNEYNFSNQIGALNSNDVYFATNLDALTTHLNPANVSCATIRARPLTADVMRQVGAAASPANIRFLGVCVPAPQTIGVLFIAPAIGANTVALHAKAIAGQSPLLTEVCDNIMPVGLINGGGIPELRQVCGSGTGAGRNCVGCFGIGDYVTSVSISTGALLNEWNNRFDSDTNTQSGIDYAEYQANATPSGSTNPAGRYGQRVVIMPTVAGGAITGFNAYFLQRRVNNIIDVIISAEAVPAVTVPYGIITAGGTPIPSLRMPVLYR